MYSHVAQPFSTNSSSYAPSAVLCCCQHDSAQLCKKSPCKVSASPRRQDVHGQLLVPEYLIRYGLGEVIAIPIVEERVCAGSLCLEQLELMLALKIQGVQEQGAFDGFWVLHIWDLFGCSLQGWRMVP